MLLSLFLIPFAAFAVQLPYAFEAEMNYFQKYKSAQEISNDTDLAATKDGIKVLMVHPDTRKVTMHDAALDEKSTNEELIDERGSIQVFSSKLQKYLQEGNFKDVIDFYLKYVEKDGICGGNTNALKGSAKETFDKEATDMEKRLRAVADIGKQVLAEALPKYCGGRIAAFYGLYGVRYRNPKMIDNEHNHFYEVHRDSSPPGALAPNGAKLLRLKPEESAKNGEKEMSFNMWFNFNEYDNPQFAMLDKRAQKKEEEVYIGLEVLDTSAVALKYGEEHRWVFYQQRGIGYATIFQTEHVFHAAFDTPKKLLPENPVNRHSMDIRFRCFYPDDDSSDTDSLPSLSDDDISGELSDDSLP